jgi:hypothetical protein
VAGCAARPGHLVNPFVCNRAPVPKFIGEMLIAVEDRAFRLVVHFEQFNNLIAIRMYDD